MVYIRIMAAKLTDSQDSVTDSSDTVPDHLCKACEDNHRETMASFYCVDCTSLYCTQCKSYHDKILKGHTVLGERDKQHWTTVADTSNKSPCLDTCSIHGNKEKDMYCGEHNDVCCAVCLHLHHRPCVDVKYLPDTAKGFLQGKQFKEHCEKVGNLHQQFVKVLETYHENLSTLDDSSQTLLDAIHIARDEITMQLDRLENITKTELVAKKTRIESNLCDHITTITPVKEDLESLHENLKSACVDTFHEIKAFSTFKQNQKIVDNGEKLLNSLQSPKVSLSFSVNKDLLKTVSSFKSMGVIKEENVLETKATTSHNVPLREDKKKSIIYNLPL